MVDLTNTPFYLHNIGSNTGSITINTSSNCTYLVSAEEWSDSFNNDEWLSGNTISVPAGHYAYIKHDNPFNSTKHESELINLKGSQFDVGGNITSLNNNYVLATSFNFYNLFKKQTDLINAKDLILPYEDDISEWDHLFAGMFSGCSNLITAPDLPTKMLSPYCYEGMFSGCSSLINPPKLSADNLNTGSYQDMFNGCTNLRQAPRIEADWIPGSCFVRMFKNCAKITNLTVLFTSLPRSNPENVFTEWLDGTAVGTTGTLHLKESGEYSFDTVQVPSNWTKVTYYPPEYFYIEYVGQGSPYQLQLNDQYGMTNLFWTDNISDYYSWQPFDFKNQPKIQEYRKIYLKGTNHTLSNKSNIDIAIIDCEKPFSVGGDITTLIDPEGSVLDLTERKYCFHNLFCNSKLCEIVDLTLPSTTLEFECYSGMFRNAGVAYFTGIKFPATTLAPYCYKDMFKDSSICYLVGNNNENPLPVTTLAEGCYYNMFAGCASLESIENLSLPATVLAEGCYYGMFDGCASLESINKISLPAPILVKDCYNRMFNGCTKLTIAPILSAKTLVDGCYVNMFNGCSNINEVTALFTTDITNDTKYTQNWLKDTSTSGVFHKSDKATWNRIDASGTNNWDIQLYSGPNYFYVENAYNGTNTLTLNNAYGMTDVEYATDVEGSWTKVVFTDIDFELSTMDITIPKGGKVYLRGTNNKLCNDRDFHNVITCSQPFNIGGDLTTLLEPRGEILDLTGKDYCFNSLFHQTLIQDISKLVLPSTTLAPHCYERMFRDCAMLTSIPESLLPATNLAYCCYSRMFAGCDKLTSIPERLLSSMTLAENCYSQMFAGCGSLVSVPKHLLPSTTLAKNCYNNMFGGYAIWVQGSQTSKYCTSLIQVPELPAMTLVEGCYSWMFSNCYSLKNAPELPAIIVEKDCYKGMFSNCTSLTKAPELSAYLLTDGCYVNMFSGCSSLTSLLALFTDHSNLANCINGWLNSVAENGTFYKDSELKDSKEDLCLPPTWNLKNREIIKPKTATANYFYIKNETGREFIFGIAGDRIHNLEYAPRPTGPWKPYDFTLQYAFTKYHETIFLRGTNNVLGDANIEEPLFSCSGSISIGGDITTLLTPKGNLLDLTGRDYCFSYIFKGLQIIDASNLILPSTKLAPYCYNFMFNQCRNLLTPPKISALELAPHCCDSMFSECTSLETTPKLPAIKMADSCYNYMFSNCLELKSAPNLPSLSLAPSCYKGMFSGCNRLTKVCELPATELYPYCYQDMFSGTAITETPKLPATKLYPYCYQDMFSGCTSLTKTPELPATELALGCYYYMFSGASFTEMPKLPAMKLAVDCYRGMFNGCPNLEKADILPAVDLEDGCYNGMFSWCTSLTRAPKLPAAKLKSDCYNELFYGCEKLKSVTALFTDNISEDYSRYTLNWLSGAPKDGTFNKSPYIPDSYVSPTETSNDWIIKNCDLPDSFYIQNDSGEDNTFTISGKLPDIKYKFEGGEWTTITENVVIPAGKRLYLIGVNTSLDGCTFTCSKKYSIGGKITTLLYTINIDTIETCINAFRNLFSGSTTLERIDPSVLDAKILSPNCYEGLFKNCTSLRTIPELYPVKTANQCYKDMFLGCDSLENANAITANASGYVHNYSNGVIKEYPEVTNIKMKVLNSDGKSFSQLTGNINSKGELYGVVNHGTVSKKLD